jgi:excisionase family DNA binding protein
MTRYIYEVELQPDSESSAWNVSVPDLPGCNTFGDDFNDALAMAADAAMTHIASCAKHGETVPEPTFGHVADGDGKIVALSFEVDASYIIDAISPSEAAVMLGVTRSRVSQMIRSGIIDAYKVGAETRVDRASIDKRLSSSGRTHKAGRPRKVAL